jgi:hypothetical protein
VLWIQKSVPVFYLDLEQYFEVLDPGLSSTGSVTYRTNQVCGSGSISVSGLDPD